MTQEEIYGLLYPEFNKEAYVWIQGYPVDRDGSNHEMGLDSLADIAKDVVQLYLWPEPQEDVKYHAIAKAIEEARFDVQQLVVLTMVQALTERYGAAKAVRFMVMESL